MISKRRFFILIMMMFVLLFMFQFTQVVKENGNTYDTNLYLQKKENIKTSECQKRQKTVLFIGKKEGKYGKVAAQWCEYTKRRLVTFGSLSECPEETAKQSEIILIQKEAVASDADLGLADRRFISRQMTKRKKNGRIFLIICRGICWNPAAKRIWLVCLPMSR